MFNVVRSELVRLRRPLLLFTWFGLVALFVVMINMVIFSAAVDGSAPPSGGPGVSFPDAATLTSSNGLVAGLSAAASMFGVVTLSFWALTTASDYATGLIRLLVSAEPRRWRLLAGKVVALLVVTAASAVVATMANVIVAPMAAQAAGLTPEAWTDNPGPTILIAFVNLFAALCVWGVIGLVLAVLFRSSAAAISIGIGYVLVVESILGMATGEPPSWLIGTTLSALAGGGNAQVSHTSATVAGIAYAVVGLALATVTFTRRDIRD
jgi:ABC-type transport system involved in multi-copper enzyme maturation permease subunit